MGPLGVSECLQAFWLWDTRWVLKTLLKWEDNWSWSEVGRHISAEDQGILWRISEGAWLQENVENNGKNYWSLLKSEVLESGMKGTNANSWSSTWGSHKMRSGGLRKDSRDRVVGTNLPVSLVCKIIGI